MNKDIAKYGVKFGEGQDPTKGGAPKGKRLSTIFAELLENPTSRLKELLPDGITGNEALALELLTIAFSKEVKDSDRLNAIKTIMDRIDGKATQEIKQTNINPVIFKTFDARKN